MINKYKKEPKRYIGQTESINHILGMMEEILKAIF